MAASQADFVAPELRDGGPATPESDVWALGATLTYARHGAPPGPALPRGRLAAVVLGALAGAAGGFALARAAEPGVTALAYGPGGAVRLAATIDDACLRGGLEAGRLGDEDRVGCAEPHRLEVLETLDPFGGREMPPPGPDHLARYAAGACTAAFDALVAAPDRHGLEIAALVPSEAAFASRAGREVRCLLRAADGGPLVGSRISGEGN